MSSASSGVTVIGPGPGAATAWLSEHVASLTVLETDAAAAAALATRHRNGNVTVLYQNMDKRFIYNFDQALTSSKDAGYYDFDSIMHYPATGFTRNAQDSMETVPVGIPIGQRNGLSAGDIDGDGYADPGAARQARGG